MAKPRSLCMRYATAAQPASVLVRAVSTLVIIAMAILLFSGAVSGESNILVILVLVGAVVCWAISGSSQHILLTDDTLIVARHLVLLDNIARLQINDEAGVLTIVRHRGPPLTIKRSGFPTNARKDWKVAKNKQAKFKRLTSALSERHARLASGAG